MTRAVLLSLLCCWLWSFELPQALPGEQERHGSFRGEPFWLRLRPADPRFGGLRVLELLYTPPDAGSLAGTFLADHPFLLLDEQLRVRAWNERSDSGSLVQYRSDLEPPAYAVTAEVHVGEVVDLSQRRHPSPQPAWDRRLTPLLLLLTAPAEEARAVDCLDIYHLTKPRPGRLLLDGDEVYEGETLRHRLERDADGAVSRVLDAQGRPLVVVGELPPPEPLEGQMIEEPEMPGQP